MFRSAIIGGSECPSWVDAVEKLAVTVGFGVGTAVTSVGLPRDGDFDTYATGVGGSCLSK
jgi:hypothetical protein